MPRYSTCISAWPSPSSGTGTSAGSKHDSVTMPTGRLARTICLFVRGATARTIAARPSLTPVPPVPIPLPIPLDVADLTAEWFTEILGRDVETVDLLDHHSGTTGRAHVALRGAPGVPATLFVKLAPFDERQREFVTQVGMGVTEAR